MHRFDTIESAVFRISFRLKSNWIVNCPLDKFGMPRLNLLSLNTYIRHTVLTILEGISKYFPLFSLDLNFVESERRRKRKNRKYSHLQIDSGSNFMPFSNWNIVTVSEQSKLPHTLPDETSHLRAAKLSAR